MYLFHFFRSFLPLHNPIGFGAIDFVELAFALCLLGALFAACVLSRFAEIALRRPRWIMAALFALPVLLRIALLHSSPAPAPSGADDFSYVLLGDTLAHLRLANPTHPMFRFFETNFVLQQPTYSSIFPLGQGLLLAGSHLLFRSYWTGVLLSSGALCGLTFWMLRGWTSDRWALAGGLLAVLQFGPLCQWTNCYWGGHVSACAGCLVFGALPRLTAECRKRDAVLLGLGLGLQLLSRPFESVLLLLCVCLYVAVFFGTNWRGSRRALGFAAIAVVPALALMSLHNHAVTGSWTTMPYQVSRFQYGVPATFTFQPNAVPHRELTQEQELDYRAQAAIHGESTDTFSSFFRRFGYRLRYYRFFFLPPLYFALLFLFKTRRRRAAVYAIATAIAFALGTNIYPYFYAHYVAALSCIFVLMSVLGLEALSDMRTQRRRGASVLLLALCGAHFFFWYALHFIGADEIDPIFSFETANYINMGDPEGRVAIERQLSRAPGRQLVFVRYSPDHGFHEWIHNGASIDTERVVWALDRGEDNQKLMEYFKDQTAWILQPDLSPPQLVPYTQSPVAFEDVK